MPYDEWARSICLLLAYVVWQSIAVMRRSPGVLARLLRALRVVVAWNMS